MPKIDVQFGLTFTSKPGLQVSFAGTPTGNGGTLQANYTVSNAVAQQSLGRPLAGNAANVTVNLIEPSSLYANRINQVDLRVGKVLRFGRAKAAINLDMFNALNSSSVLAVNSAFGGTTPWQRPQSILQARLLKISTQFDF